MIGIILVDDHAVVRDGLRLLLEQQPDFEVLAEAGSAREGVERILELHPAVAVLDIGLGAEDGIPVIEAITARAPETRVLVLSMFTDGETVRQAFLAGAAGYLVKGAGVAELVAAVRAVAAGRSFVHNSIAAVVLGDGLRWLRSGTALSPREREVLSLLAAGATARRIGQALGISAHTVRRHLANASVKLDLHGSLALSRYALDHGLARPSPLPNRPLPEGT